MRTKSVFRLVDTITWLLIALFPLLLYGCQLLGHSGQYMEFWTYCNNFSNTFSAPFIDNFINNILSYINCNLGTITPIITWFVLAQIIHFLVDVLLWIFRLCHHWLNKAVDNL